MASYRRLAWDSDFLGLAVARIAHEIEDEESVTHALAELKSAGVRLAYWQPRYDEDLRNFARERGATFVGTQVRFECSSDAPRVRSELRLERPGETTPELEALAVQAG